MKDSDQAMEKVLAGLRDAKAPMGMERRILEGLQSRTADSVRQGWLTRLASRIAVRPIGYVALMAGGMAIILAIPAAIQLLQHAPVQSAQETRSAPLPPVPSMTAAESVELQRPAIVTRSPRRPKPRKLEAADPEEALAMREMNAPSRPAPPLPLTEQEKALVRFVRTRTPEELAAIDPAKWAAQDEQQRAEFDRFFRRFTKEQADKKKLAQEAMNKSWP